MKDILLITPPFTQLNTPYPATAYLKGFLESKGYATFQLDLGIEVILELFSKKGLSHLFEEASALNSISSANALKIYALKDRYIRTIDDVISFLQGRNQAFARQICSSGFLPEASRFDHLDDLSWSFGEMGFQDKAKHLATLYLEDLSDFIVETVDPHFGFSRYAERLARSAHSFDELYAHLQEKETFIDEITLKIFSEKMMEHKAKIIGFSIPFPGNLYSAFRIAQYCRRHYPEVKIVMGGGFPNTELRSLTEPRVFEFFDYIALDDGELPFELIITKILNVNNCKNHLLKRTYTLLDQKVVYTAGSGLKDYSQNDIACPDYGDLKLENYISVIEVANPMHSLWSDGRWIKLTMAHGCYWGKCTFCDVSLDYIKNYEALSARLLVDRVEKLIQQTGEKGFHFVDEAAPPALMKAFALEILKRKLTISWWTNIRFEKSFTRDLCLLLKASGCIAVSGGLEVASDRLLQLIKKGTSIKQVAQVCGHFTEAGIMVHTYLMYGYPSQTVQETIDSLELVRQLFELGLIQSGFWHQFALTAHSPIGLDPKAYGIRALNEKISFAHNDVMFEDETGIVHEVFSAGLKQSLYNYMLGTGFELSLQKWFDFSIPKTSIPKGYIAAFLNESETAPAQQHDRLFYLGSKPLVSYSTRNKQGEKTVFIHLHCYTQVGELKIKVEKAKGEWLIGLLEKINPEHLENITFADAKSDFEQSFQDFELFWQSSAMYKLRNKGLLLL